MFLLEGALALRQILCCQGPWNVDLRTPPGPEGSNGSLLCMRRGHPGFFQCRICDRPSLPAPPGNRLVNRKSNVLNEMSYQVIARKYRPQRFSDVVGQE